MVNKELENIKKLGLGTLLTKRKIINLISLLSITPVIGDFAEAGVFTGGSAVIISGRMPKDRTFYMFDSWDGVPKPGINDHKVWFEGRFKVDNKNHIITTLEGLRKNNVVVKGTIPKTFKKYKNNRYAFVHIDVDLYQSTKDCLEYFWPRLNEYGIMVFDDYHAIHCKGAKKAIDEFLNNRHYYELPIQESYAIKKMGE